MNRDNTMTLVFENHQSDARKVELKEGGGMPDFRIDAERIGGEQQPAGRRNLVVKRWGRGVWWDGAECASTVTTRSLGQYMPDKDNFGAVIAYVQ